MVPLGQHLGADQDLSPTGGKIGQNGLGALGPPGHIPIQAQYRDPVRQDSGQLLLQEFGADAHGQKAGAAADRTRRGMRPGIPAIMADEPLPVLVVGERQLATRAPDRIFAVQAIKQRRVSPAIEQDHGLIPGGYGLDQGPGSLIGQYPQTVAGLALAGHGSDLARAAHVHQLDFRQPSPADPARQGNHGHLPQPGGLEGLHIRCRRTEHEEGPGLPGPKKGHFLGLIRQAVFLFEGAVMLLIENNEAQLAQRQKEGRARAGHNARGIRTGHAAKGRLPDRRGLVAVGKKHGLPGKGLGGGLVETSGQGHFRGQEQHPFASFEGQPGQFQIEPGLAAAGHAENQPGDPVRRDQRRGQGGQGLRLIGGQRRQDRRRGLGRTGRRGRNNLPAPGIQTHKRFVRQPAHNRHQAGAEPSPEIGKKQRSLVAEQVQERELSGRPGPYRPGRVGRQGAQRIGHAGFGQTAHGAGTPQTGQDGQPVRRTLGQPLGRQTPRDASPAIESEHESGSP